MADIQIDTTASDFGFSTFSDALQYWTSPLIGYFFYTDADRSFVYKKTADGGLTFGTVVVIDANTCGAVSIWPKEWTTGDKTHKMVHIAYMETATDDLFYISLDTADDSLTTRVSIKSSTSSPLSTSIIVNHAGNLAITFNIRYANGPSGMWTADVTGDVAGTWTDRADPHVSNTDTCRLSPGIGGSGDDDDFWVVTYDESAKILKLLEFDDSANTFNTITIVDTSAETSPALFDTGFNLTHRWSDNHTIVGVWDNDDDADARLRTFDLGGSFGSPTATEKGVAASGAESAKVSMFIDQQTDKLFCSYLTGAAWESLTKPYYVGSTDGGATWDSPTETVLTDAAQDDIRAVWAGTMVGDNGGRFMPFWHNDDLNDVITNFVNSLSIAASGVSLSGATPAPSGSLSLAAFINLAGATPAPAGALSFAGSIALAGATPAPSGALSLAANIALAGATPAPSGAIAIVDYAVPLAGATPAPSGSLQVDANINLSGATPAPSGGLAFAAGVALSGSTPAPSGALTVVQALLVSLAGATPASVGVLVAVLGNLTAISVAARFDPSISLTAAHDPSISLSAADDPSISLTAEGPTA